MRGEVLGVERRRFWSDEEKLSIVSSVGINGATVTQVAQQHEITRQQIYTWRHELKKKGLWSAEAGAIFLPMNFPATEMSLPSPDPVVSVSVALGLSGGRCLRFDSTLDAGTLTRLIRAVEEA